MLTRRDLLKAAALLSTSLTGCGGSTDTTGSGPASAPTPRNDVDVAIVGSGVAGLVAAQTVIQAGRSYAVLEARNRPGGRTVSDNTTFAPQPVDLGAQFFHQSEINPLYADALKQGIPTVADTGPREFFLNGAPAPQDQVALLLQTAAGVELAVETAGAAARLGQPDLSLGDATASLTGEPYFLLAVAGLLNGRTGFPLAEPTSSLDYSNFTNTSPLTLAGLGDDIFIPSGMGNFVLATYARGVNISLNTPVTAITWGSNGVNLSTPQGTLRARTVVITVPVSLLAAGSISFSPALPPEYQSAFNNIILGTVNKVFLEFSGDPFGVPAGTFATPLLNTESLAPTVINMFGAGLTLSFLDGDLAKQFEAQGPQAAVEYVLAELTGVFGNRVRPAYTGRNLVTSWGSEPYSLGAYSSVRPGHVDDRTQLGTPLNNQLFFAGEAVSLGSHGSINAAYTSGQLAALGALKALSSAS